MKRFAMVLISAALLFLVTPLIFSAPKVGELAPGHRLARRKTRIDEKDLTRLRRRRGNHRVHHRHLVETLVAGNRRTFDEIAGQRALGVTETPN